jgi:sugar (pentulose or hexulose) kinase
MEIDMVTTPGGSPVAMVHCNNCSSDIDAWAGLFREFGELAGVQLPFKRVLDMLFFKALEGDPDCGGLTSYNYLSGEPITGLTQGRPLFVRTPESRFTLSNFMRTHLQSALATLKIGLDILRAEQVKIDRMYGHGGYFKAKGVGQRLTAAAIGAPVYVMETAGEGGAWGAAVLAAYLMNRAEGQSLEDYLNDRVFSGSAGEKIEPEHADEAGFETFMARYVRGLAAEHAAAENIE